MPGRQASAPRLGHIGHSHGGGKSAQRARGPEGSVVVRCEGVVLRMGLMRAGGQGQQHIGRNRSLAHAFEVLRVQQPQAVQPRRVALAGGLEVPVFCQAGLARFAQAFFIDGAQPHPGQRRPLRCRLAQPIHGLGVILGDVAPL